MTASVKAVISTRSRRDTQRLCAAASLKGKVVSGTFLSFGNETVRTLRAEVHTASLACAARLMKHLEMCRLTVWHAICLGMGSHQLSICNGHLMSTTTGTSAVDCRQLIDRIVRPSFERFCAGGVEVFDDFYYSLSDRLPVVGSMFAQVDMEQQNQLIRDGISDLIDFASGNEQAKSELERLAKTHSRSGLGVRPEFYSLWIDALMETVRKHDAQATDETEAAWRKVLSNGITQMIEGY